MFYCRQLISPSFFCKSTKIPHVIYLSSEVWKKTGRLQCLHFKNDSHSHGCFLKFNVGFKGEIDQIVTGV